MGGPPALGALIWKRKREREIERDRERETERGARGGEGRAMKTQPTGVDFKPPTNYWAIAVIGNANA